MSPYLDSRNLIALTSTPLFVSSLMTREDVTYVVLLQLAEIKTSVDKCDFEWGG